MNYSGILFSLNLIKDNDEAFMVINQREESLTFYQPLRDRSLRSSFARWAESEIYYDGPVNYTTPPTAASEVLISDGTWFVDDNSDAPTSSSRPTNTQEYIEYRRNRQPSEFIRSRQPEPVTRGRR